MDDPPEVRKLLPLFLAYKRELEAKQQAQGGVPTWLDNFHGNLIAYLGAFAAEGSLVPRDDYSRAAALHACRELATFLGLRSGERLVSLSTRLAPEIDPTLRPHIRFAEASTRSEIPATVMNRSQGAHAPIQWRGRNLFKTAFDVVLYSMMLSELKPGTIIELGSGDGGSAAWFRDMAVLVGLDTGVCSFDIRPPPVSFPGVRFLEADLTDPERTMDRAALEEEPHPWLVIEDAHVNTLGVMQFFHPSLRKGDYLVVEDSGFGKLETALVPFCRAHAEEYRVDTRYTDFFGRNATSSPDSILVRV